MAWITFGKGRPISVHATGGLITAVANWYDDSYMSWGDKSRAAGDRYGLELDCQNLIPAARWWLRAV